MHARGDAELAEKCLNMCDWGACRELAPWILEEAPGEVPGVTDGDWPVRLCGGHLRILLDMVSPAPLALRW